MYNEYLQQAAPDECSEPMQEQTTPASGLSSGGGLMLLLTDRLGGA